MKHTFRFDGTLIDPEHGTWQIAPEERIRIQKVLRLAPGDIAEVHNGKGQWSRGPISKSDGVYFLKSTEVTADPRAKSDVRVAVGMIQPEKWPSTIAALIELGASQIIFFGQDHTPKKLFSEKTHQKFVQYARDATKLAKRSWATDVRIIKSIDQYFSNKTLQSAAGSQRYYLHQKGQKFGDTLQTQETGVVELVIGGERGLSEEEIQWLKVNEFQAARIGGNILQATTAAISAMGIVAASCSS